MDWRLQKSSFHSTNLVFNRTHHRYFKIQIILELSSTNISPFFPASMLIFTEAYAEAVKTCKYYYFVTLFAYESIWFLSIANLAYTLMSTWSIEEYITELQDMPRCGSAFFVSISKLLYVIACGFACFLHWIKNTFVHISLCHSKFSGVSRCCNEKLPHFKEESWIVSCHFIFLLQQAPKINHSDHNLRLLWFIEYFLPLIFVILSSILIVHNNMAFIPGHGFFLPIYYVACIAGL